MGIPQLETASAMHAAMILAAELCFPILGASLFAGVSIALFQAITQINDSTLSFLPKLVAAGAALWIGGPFMARALSEFMLQMMDAMIAAGGA